ncbi:MAG TPA: T9SS type A sorting domain-containing protein [Chitinophagaceae bacterium]|nr:T9SS type A sorting domain-containing protein [Chitinophagaceae bacterium]
MQNKPTTGPSLLLTTFVVLMACTLVAGIFIFRSQRTNLHSGELEEDQEQRAAFSQERWKHEFEMLRDPVLNRIPAGIRQQELAQAFAIPQKIDEIMLSETGASNQNNYAPAGPNNIGGRTRAIAFDKRNNQVIIAGCVSGGIMRSQNGGQTWARVSPEEDIHNLTALAQDPRPGSEDTWYAGAGEPLGNSASLDGALYLGHGIWKSTDNGVTWTKLTLDIAGLVTPPGGYALELFDHPFDYAHRITVNPVNGHVYVAGHRRLIRSQNGGASWEMAFNTVSAATAANGQMDVVCTSTGRLYLALNGGSPDGALRGVWTSPTGNAGSWTRIAGGQVLNVDSVAGWRGNDYTAPLTKRIVMALAPSNQNLLYVLYENGLSQAGPAPQPEVDMFLYNNAGSTWTNLSANMPDFPGDREGVDPIAIQGGYDMMVYVKPDNPNVVLLGGTCLYRSVNGFTNTAGTSWIGGYGNTLPTLSIYPNSHPDMHAIAFDPSNPNRVVSANDGGLQVTTDIMANVSATVPVNWAMLRNYQTLQYYHVAMDPGQGRNNFIGGSQDNGTHVRDAELILGARPGDRPDVNDHARIVGGDGGASGFGKVSSNSQLAYMSSQLGDIYRATFSGGVSAFNGIKPNGLTPNSAGGFGDFVTYFKIDFDNPELLYYVNFNRLFRTTTASTVSAGTWTELTAVSAAVNPTQPTNGNNISISALEVSRGDYGPTHSLYIGTDNGKIFRLDNPRDVLPITAPVNITPPQFAALGAVYISDIAVNPNNDSEIMAVVSNYTANGNSAINIWWTDNAKSASPTWRLAEGNLTMPSARSCMIVVKRDASNIPVTEYYVGTSVGLYSTVNMGPRLLSNQPVTWVREGGNTLNYAVISSMDYRPQDNVLLVGTHGNGMYFTSTGTPDFQGQALPGGIFIQNIFPTLARGNSIRYTVGNTFDVQGIIVQIYSSTGQLLYNRQDSYQSRLVNIAGLPAGTYVLSITSRDGRHKFVRRFVKTSH